MSYDWKKTAKKIVKQLLFLLVAGAAVVYSENPYFLAIQPLLTGLENAVSHWND